MPGTVWNISSHASANAGTPPLWPAQFPEEAYVQLWKLILTPTDLMSRMQWVLPRLRSELALVPIGNGPLSYGISYATELNFGPGWAVMAAVWTHMRALAHLSCTCRATSQFVEGECPSESVGKEQVYR